jgi:hypothetical protein
MADARREYRSAFRGARTGKGAPPRPSVSYPQSERQPKRRPNAASQARALEKTGENGKASPPLVGFAPYFGLWEGLPAELQGGFRESYGRGGFNAVSQMQGWYDLPEHVRRMILEGVRA